nr:extracellular protease inhibitor 10-like [Maniola hyperantus]
MFTLAKYIFFASFIEEILLFVIKDDFPVPEYLGCGQCPRVYAPVCGTDHKTYVNACKLNCVNSQRSKQNWVYMERYGMCLDTGLFFF